ncbi:hypothetical protein NX722_13490 [Endozoicomonas gorgoniicola]|uniref:Uncharacterized protein n=1 Tax=Endozoicomonas gorgoniicola TaxID=1234144 RepID=A0ABT3MW69_9GAMM|nr:hypothetical protein [Endozoicomonas gorgoniicola]MCW7553621.1 hypothetical protein [Endozoicomonas gorgoniicola]
MKFEIGPYEKKTIVRDGIFVDGERVGELVKSECKHYPFRAVLNIHRGLLKAGLAQGGGKTPEEAIQNAFVDSRKDATQYLEGLDVLAGKLGVEISDD